MLISPLLSGERGKSSAHYIPQSQGRCQRILRKNPVTEAMSGNENVCDFRGPKGRMTWHGFSVLVGPVHFPASNADCEWRSLESNTRQFFMSHKAAPSFIGTGSPDLDLSPGELRDILEQTLLTVAP